MSRNVLYQVIHLLDNQLVRRNLIGKSLKISGLAVGVRTASIILTGQTYGSYREFTKIIDEMHK